MKADLTLESKKKTIRQREAVHEQQWELKGSDTIKTVDAQNRTNRTGGIWAHYDANQKFQRTNPKLMTAKPLRTRNCTRCGKDAYPKDKCPSKDVECYRCKRKGHYGSMCFSKATTAHSVEADLTSVGTTFLDNCLLQLQRQPGWPIYSWKVNKLDTGAEVTAISSDTLP